jgi:hypothetical protein
MENKMKKLKMLVASLLAVLGKKLPRNANNEDLKIVALILSNKIDLGLNEALETIKSKSDKAVKAANKIVD